MDHSGEDLSADDADVADGDGNSQRKEQIRIPPSLDALAHPNGFVVHRLPFSRSLSPIEFWPIFRGAPCPSPKPHVKDLPRGAPSRIIHSKSRFLPLHEK